MRQQSVCVLIALLLLEFAPQLTGDGHPAAGESQGVPQPVDTSRLLQQRIEGEKWTAGPSNSTCGVYAACRALQLLDVEVNAGDYFTQEYISTFEGSSPEQVVKLIESNGCRGLPLTNLSKLDLLAVGHPVIANVKQSPNATVFDHWVCVLYADGGLQVFDGPAGAVEMTFAEFLPLWSGYGVIASREGTHTLWATWILRASVLLVFAVVGIVCWQVTAQMDWFRARSWSRLAATTLGLAIVGNSLFTDAGDLFGRFGGTGPVPGQPHRVADLDELRHCVSEQTHVLIDARYQHTFERGAIEGAVNVPVEVSPIALRGLLRDVDRSTPILIYCHSEGCEFDAIVADKLNALGFDNLTTSRAGWVEYKTK
jgi:rhodanese-related sulfurtransferase